MKREETRVKTEETTTIQKKSSRRRRQLYGSLLLITLLLNGCASGAKVESAAGQAEAANGGQAQSQSQSSSQDGSQQKDAQGAKGGFNQQQFQMMMTFQSLLMMDKAEGLSITKDEAAQMLPVVQETITAGELTDDNKTKLLSGLTDGQKKFIEDSAAKRPMRQGDGGNRGGADGKEGRGGNGSGNGNGNGGRGNRPSPSPNDAAAAQASPSGDQASSGGGQGSGDQKPRGQGRPEGGGFQGGRNPGQQLVELLQSKTK